MRVTLDGVKLPIDDNLIAEGKKAIFEAARRSAVSNNRVIVGITVDDVRIEEEEAFLSLSGGIDIQFISQPIIDLVRESVEEGRRYIPTLLKGLEGIATMIEEGREKDAQVPFSQAVEGINWLVGVFAKSSALLGITAEGLSSGNWNDDSRRLNETLEEMISVMEGGRMMRMAYIIRERLIPVMKRFASYWSDISAQLESPLQ
ncbi:MAG: hypothetical protein LBG12_04220 [Synergistaceae bacterium]|jgi:hypothetical protein|nr:hypothetical protein [Synergistaceae bacterium]